MTAINVVRFRVKPGREKEFEDGHRKMEAAFPGMRRAWLVKTGERTYCIVGVWRDMQLLAAARPKMIANLDKLRGCLEEIAPGLGVTDPVSGEVVVELGEREKGARGKAAAEKPAVEKAAAEKRAGGKARELTGAERRARRAARAERVAGRGGKGGGGGGGGGGRGGKNKARGLKH